MWLPRVEEGIQKSIIDTKTAIVANDEIVIMVENVVTIAAEGVVAIIAMIIMLQLLLGLRL